LCLIWGLPLWSGIGQAASAADPSFVGVLALAVDKDVADRLGLSDEARGRLRQLVNEREDAALEMVLSIKDLPPMEQTARLTPFVEESERLGFALLTVAQREKLRQIRLAREGMSALSEPGLSEALNLSAEQKSAVQDLLNQRAMDLTKGGENERRITRAVYERKLASVLNDSQRATWETLSGLSDAPASVPSGPTAATAAAQAAPPPPVVAATEAEKPAMTPSAIAPAVTEQATTTSPPAVATTEAEKPAMTPPAIAPAETEQAVTPPPAVAATEAEKPAMPPSAVAPVETEQAAMSAAPPTSAVAAGGGLRFQFDAAPWKDVLEWLAQQSGLSLAIETLPVGSFTYRDDRTYTLDEALDLLNSYLLTKGYTLVRRQRILLVLDVENPIPEELVTLVTTEELDQRGQFELVKCLFPLARMKAEDAAAMIKDFIGPQGKVIPFPKARQILVTETAGKLRTIREMISRVEDPESGGAETVAEFNLQHASSEELLSIARPLLGIPEGQNSATDISLSVDLLGTRIWATGSADKLQLLRELIPKIDKAPAETGEAAKEPEQLTLASYFIKSADSQLVLRVVQTLLADLPGVRLEVDATSGKMVAWARPSEHKIIADTLALLEGQDLQFEVIPLKRTDPQLAVAAINKFFGLTTATGDSKTAAKAPAQGPIVDGDPVTMQLWVRGTVLQIEQVKDLLEKLEGPDAEEGSGATIRTIPLSGPAAKSALETIEQFWTLKNKIRMVTPSNLTPSADIKLRVITPLEQQPENATPEGTPGDAPWMPLPSQPPGVDPAAGNRTPPATEAGKSAHVTLPQRADPRRADGLFQFVSQPKPADEPAGAAPETPVTPGAAASSDREPAEIRIAVTSSGIIIASEDTKALDELEKLLRTVNGPTALQGQREISVFYLKFAKADVAYQLLQEVLGGHASDTGGSLLGDMASNLLGGGLIGGLVGGLAGGTSSSGGTAALQASGPVTVVADPRLNALIVEANPVDLAFVEQMLRVIDKESSETEIQTTGVTRLIPVIYGSADEVASVIREVFADRMAGSQGRGQGQQPNPEDLLRALRGQRSQREDSQTRGEPAKMTVGVDSRSNSVIVTAPEPLFRQVEEVVRQIDQPGGTDTDVVSVVPIKVSDPELVQKTLNSILGSSSSRSGSRSSAGSPPTGGSSGGPSADDIRRRIEFFQQLRGSGGGGPPSGFGGPGGFAPPGGGDSGRRSSGGRSRGR
jgi:type II secretory pathway component GspD/PulD (secretin)